MRKIDDQKLLELWDNGKGMQQKDLAKYFGVSNAAICKRIKRLTESEPEMPESFSRLTDKEKKFVLEKAQGKTGVEAALSSFDVTTRDSAKSIATRLMKDPDIETALADIMAQEGLSRRYRIQKLKRLIDHQDPTASARGLDMAFKVAGDYAPEKIAVAVDIRAMIEEVKCIDAEIAKLEGELKRLGVTDYN